MRYYEYRPDPDKYDSLGVIESRPGSSDCDYIQAMCRIPRPVADNWRSPPFHGYDEDDVGVEGDFPSFPDSPRIPIFSERAWHALESLLGENIEPLPIEHPEGKHFFLIHIIWRIPALDESRSEFLRNKATGRISMVTRFAFKEDKIHGVPMFQLTGEMGGAVIVDEEFRQAVERNNLKGLLFKPLPMAVPRTSESS